MEKRYIYLLEKIKSEIISNSFSNYLLCLRNGKEFKKNLETDDIYYIKEDKEYSSTLRIIEYANYNELEFTLFNDNCSKSLLKYILDFLTSEDKCFYRIINGIVLTDFHNTLLKIKKIRINNAIIDDKVINILNKYFNDLNLIKFHDCVIKENCNFYKLHGNLYFANCEIENIKSFNYCKQDLQLYDTKINKISNSIINSKIININGLNDVTISKIFLLCHFPELKKLNIGNSLAYILNSNLYYEKCLLYMPYACPDLETLFIEGKISSFDFLYHFKKLNKCEIRSFNDSIGYYEIYNPCITNKKEKETILKNSNCKLNSEMDIHLAYYDRLNRILEMLSLFRYSSEEKEIYVNHDISTILLNPLKGFSEKSIEYFYSYDLKEKLLKLISKDKDDIFEDFVMNNYFFETKKIITNRLMKIKQQIIVNSPCIYHPSGIPIVFQSQLNVSQQKQVDRALRRKDWFIDNEYERIIEETRDKLLNIKKRKYFNLLMETIYEYYDNFDINQLKQIFNELRKVWFNCDSKFPYILKDYEISINKDSQILEEANNKTNKQLCKYLNLVKMVEHQREFK